MLRCSKGFDRWEGHGGCGNTKAGGRELLHRGPDLSYNSTAR